MTPTPFLIYGKPAVFTFSRARFSTPQQVVARPTRRCIVPGRQSSNWSTENSLQGAQPIRAVVAAAFRRASFDLAFVAPGFTPAAFHFDLEDSVWPQL